MNEQLNSFIPITLSKKTSQPFKMILIVSHEFFHENTAILIDKHSEESLQAFTR